MAKTTQPTIMHSIKRQQNKTAYLFLMPMLFFFLLFVILPMGIGIVTSFFNYTMKDFNFIGFKNYQNLFKDEKFLMSLKNTVFIVFINVPFVTFFSLWASTVIGDLSKNITSLFRCIFYLPVVTGSVCVVVVWKWIFNKYNGILNWLFLESGIIDSNIDWLGDKSTAIWCILLILFTTSIGQPIILYVASLGNIDRSILEASEVDGATPFQKFWLIKWSCLKPTTLYIVVITTINSFQIFALIQLLTSGGPVYSTSTVMYYLYKNAFTLTQYGYANSIGVFLAIIIASFSAIQFKLMKSDVKY